MISRRLFIAVLSLAIFLTVNHTVDAAARTAYAIIDAQSGFVLDQVDAKDKRQVGSLTKVATAMVVLDWAEKARRRFEPARHHSA